MIRKILFGGSGAATIFGDAGLLILRLWIGLALAFGHGINKIPPGEQVVGMVEGLGLPGPVMMNAWLAGICEFGGGLLIALGLFTRFGALLVLGAMCTAAFMFHIDDPLFGSPPTKEMALLYAAPAFFLLLAGAGRFSLDWVARKATGAEEHHAGRSEK